MENQSATTPQQSQKRSAIIAVVVLVVVIAAALVAYQAISSTKADGEAQAGAVKYDLSDTGSADEAAKVLACLIYDNDGNPALLGDIADGRPVIVNVWATWCPYCVAEMDDYQKLYESYGDDVRFVMLNASDTSSEVTKARSYVADQAYSFPVYFDAEFKFIRLFGITSLPTTVVLSAEGHVLLQRVGQIDYSSMDATLAALTGKQ